MQGRGLSLWGRCTSRTEWGLMKTTTTLAAVAALMIAAGRAAGAKADGLFTQAWDAAGAAAASQNDISGGNGNFATVYDNFTLASSATITGVAFTGVFFNPPTAAAISGFT